MTKVFSDYEIDAMSIKLDSEESFSSANCVGSVEEELETKVITKKCRGEVVKTRVRGTGNGTLKISMHIPYSIFTSAYGMDLEGLITGVKAYGKNSVHKVMAIVMHIKDEDGNEKCRAYPNAIIQTGVSRKTENGAEEVAEIELEVSLMPDDYGNCMYEGLASELPDTGTITADTWMTAFTSEAMQAGA